MELQFVIQFIQLSRLYDLENESVSSQLYLENFIKLEYVITNVRGAKL